MAWQRLYVTQVACLFFAVGILIYYILYYSYLHTGTLKYFKVRVQPYFYFTAVRHSEFDVDLLKLDRLVIVLGV